MITCIVLTQSCYRVHRVDHSFDVAVGVKRNNGPISPGVAYANTLKQIIQTIYDVTMMNIRSGCIYVSQPY